MIKFIAAAHKELLLLRRDRSGLLVLFAMPAVLVLVITLVQENVMKTMGQSDTKVLFVDRDGGSVAKSMEKTLSGAQGVEVVTTLDGAAPDAKTARQAVAKGRFQLCLIVPEGLTAVVRAEARRAAMRALSMDEPQSAGDRSDVQLEVYYDPAVTGGFRTAVGYLLKLMIVQIEVEEKMNQLAQLLPDQFRTVLKETLGPMAAEGASGSTAIFDLRWDPDPIIKIHASSPLGTADVKTPNAVQQNVPAWSLFGIFFIVLPMAGSFIKERLSGVQQRMLSLPVSYLTIVSGKVCAYLVVCMVQFGLILLIGKWVLPLLGTPPFEVGVSPGAVLVVALSAAVAAAGYGILVGTLVKSYEQASMFGPISIVIAAALGGIMVPVYAMPPIMQKISMLSPLAWAQNAFLELFVRGGDLLTVLNHVALLLAFASTCILFAWIFFIQRIGKGTV